MGHKALMAAVVCLIVCPSLDLPLWLSVPDHNSRMEGHSKLKIGRMETHDMCDLRNPVLDEIVR